MPQQDLFVDIAEPIDIEVDCDGEVGYTVDGVALQSGAPIVAADLGLGDHVIEVRCDDEPVAMVRAVVYEQEETSPSGTNMVVIVMFVMMTAGAVFFLPGAAGITRPGGTGSS